MNFQIASLITKKEVHILARSSQSVKNWHQIRWFRPTLPTNHHICPDHPEVMEPPGIVVSDHYDNMNGSYEIDESRNSKNKKGTNKEMAKILNFAYKKF